MVQDANGNLYGTTTLGGLYGKGSIFKLTITSAPQITMQPSDQSAFAGGGVSFSVGAGELLGVVGPSAAGKSP